jgi:hypothetical protein
LVRRATETRPADLREIAAALRSALPAGVNAIEEPA